MAAGCGRLTGSMTSELTRDCDIYRTETKLTADLEGPTGTMPMTMDSVMSEGADSFDFDIAGEFATIEIDRARGTATRTGDGVAITLIEPQADTSELEGEIVFPLAMIQASIDAAQAGKSLVDFVAL